MTTDLRNATALTACLRAIATELGLLAEDTATEPVEPLCGQIRFAGRPADGPAHDLLLLWSERTGWELAAADGPSRCVHVVASFPGGAALSPQEVADSTLRTVAARGERVVRRHRDGDSLGKLLDRYTRIPPQRAAPRPTTHRTGV